jgi:hypothetical protein
MKIGVLQEKSGLYDQPGWAILVEHDVKAGRRRLNVSWPKMN